MTTKTILIADDDPGILRSLEIRCKSLGFRVESARNGLGAFAKARQSTPDLMILDLHMPGVDGLSLCKHFSQWSYPRVPVIILTGGGSVADQSESDALGVRYCLKGEVTWNELTSAILEMLGPSDAGGRGTRSGSQSLPA